MGQLHRMSTRSPICMDGKVIKSFSGHNYENSSQTMDHLIKKLERSTPGGGIYFYRLGKLTHYIADSFTHVHNGYFTGSLAEHVQYEVLCTNAC